MGDTRLNTDECSYSEQLKRSIDPGLYYLNTPYDDCGKCDPVLPDDPFLRFQNYGPNSCMMKKAIDDNSELLGLNYKNSKCNSDAFYPGKYISSGCVIKTNENKDCFNKTRPTESTKLSNPPCSLRGTGINRWEWLWYNPQDYVLEKFNRVPTNVKALHKDNHIPFIEKPINDDELHPNKSSSFFNYTNDLEKWQKINKDNISYSPGYPYGNNPNNYNLNCDNNIRSY